MPPARIYGVSANTWCALLAFAGNCLAVAGVLFASDAARGIGHARSALDAAFCANANVTCADLGAFLAMREDPDPYWRGITRAAVVLSLVGVALAAAGFGATVRGALDEREVRRGRARFDTGARARSRTLP